MSYVETAPIKNSTIMLLYAERDEIETSPDYQRAGGVWTIEKKRLLIDSILNDYDIPKIYFHIYSNSEITASGKRYAIIDGRQRLETIWSFIDGDFVLADDFEYQKEPEIRLDGLSYDDIAKQYPRIRIKFDSFVLPVVGVTTQGEASELIEDMFSRLNEAVPLNAAEKRNAFGGEMVRAINRIAGHPFFVNCVRFANRRYQHKESAARFLLIEDSLTKSSRIIDTKKVYLDNLVKKNRVATPHTQQIESGVLDVMTVMSQEFASKDQLLMAQGSLVIYYLAFKFALESGELAKITRRNLLDFQEKLASNRTSAVLDYPDASFDLLEYDRLSQQGTNDASSIKERYSILARELGLSRIEV